LQRLDRRHSGITEPRAELGTVLGEEGETLVRDEPGDADRGLGGDADKA
jgi:hypothetical protein